MFEKNWVRENKHVIIVMPLVPESYVLKMFSIARKRKAGVFKNLSEELRFRDGVVWTVGITVIKVRFQNFSVVLWTPYQSAKMYVNLDLNIRTLLINGQLVCFVLGHCNCIRCGRSLSGSAAALVRSRVNGLILFERTIEQITETIPPKTKTITTANKQKNYKVPSYRASIH